MPTIDSPAEATQVANLISAGKLTGADKDTAMAALRAFDTAHSASSDDRSADAPANTFVDPHTGQPTDQAPLQPMSTIASEGIVEPARRALGGVEQLGDKAIDYVSGSNYGDAQTAKETARRAQWSKDHPGTSEGLEDLAAGAISSVVPIGAATKTSTAMGALFKGMVTGGAASALQFTPEGQSKAKQTAIGSGAGGLFGLLGGIIPAGKNMVTRAVTEAEKNERVKAVRDAAGGFFNGSKRVPVPAPHSIAQSTGDPMIERLQGRAFGSKQQELGATQADQARDRFEELAEQSSSIAKMPASSPDVATAINKALDQTVTNLRKTRNDAFQKGMTATLALDAGSAAPVRVKLDNLRDAYGEVIAQDSNAFNIHGQTLPKAFQATLDMLSPTTTSAAKMTDVGIPALQTVMQGLGQDAQHGAGTFLSPADQRLERYRKMLFSGLEKDIDAAGVKVGSNPAYTELKKTRQAYAQHSDQLRQIENDSITRLFGSPENVQNPAAALDQFYALKPDDQRFAVGLLGRNHPEVVEAMRSHQITTAVDAARVGGNAKNSEFDLKTFNESMFGQGRDKSPLWQGGGITASAVREGAAHLKILLNAPMGGGGSVVGAEDIAINVMSRNPAFAARMMTRLAYQKGGDELLGTKEGLDALRTLSNTTSRTSQTYAAALAYVTNLARKPSVDPNAQGQ